MATTVARTITPDVSIHFEINPGTLLKFLESRAEGGPRLKCFQGSVTLVSPGRSHETLAVRLEFLLAAVCLEFDIEREGIGSTTLALPSSAEDTAYEPDRAYYVQSQGKVKTNQPPDLVVEVVVSDSADKALWAGAFLKIPELWVFDIPRRRLTFYHLATRGKSKGAYRPQPRSRAFPMLSSAEVLERLDDPATGDMAFFKNCRAWARRLPAPRDEDT